MLLSCLIPVMKYVEARHGTAGGGGGPCVCVTVPGYMGPVPANQLATQKGEHPTNRSESPPRHKALYPKGVG